MTYSGKPQAKHDEKADILRRTFTDRRIRLTVRDVMKALGYRSVSSAMNEIAHQIKNGVMEYDDGKYYLT